MRRVPPLRVKGIAMLRDNVAQPDIHAHRYDFSRYRNDSLVCATQRTASFPQPRHLSVRTLIILLGGLVLWAACLGVARLVATASPSASTAATVAFVAIWFVAAAVNMWLGVAHAGYSFQEELPIFLLIFLLPAAVAVIVKWRFL
jgi:hypothetical protein